MLSVSTPTAPAAQWKDERTVTELWIDANLTESEIAAGPATEQIGREHKARLAEEEKRRKMAAARERYETAVRRLMFGL